jgi:glycosyltransferase involved in cell wall biosynthesis
MRVSIITGLSVQSDAISETVRGTALALSSRLQADVRLYAWSNEFEGINFKEVSTSTDILDDAFFKRSDILIYHFGMYYAHFNTILLGNGFAPRIVRFHNVTPIEFVPERGRPMIEASLSQVANIGDADEVWADSAFNRHTLIEYGIEPSKILFMPLYAKTKYKLPYRTDKIMSPLQIIYVGRFVRSKGVIEIIDIAEDILRRGINNFKIVLAGNARFSEPLYISSLKSAIKDRCLSQYVEFAGTIDDDRLVQLYRESSIFLMPSYHEGFCMPVAEAMASRCVPVAYAAGNVPDLVGELGKLAPVGDRRRLADLLAETIADLDPSTGQPAFIDATGRRLALEDYDRLVSERLEMFSYRNFADAVAERVRRLASGRCDPSNEFLASYSANP